MSHLELFIFAVIETVAVIIFIVCFKISRKSGGAFDRRVSERRSRIRRTADWVLENGLYPERNFGNLKVELSGGNEIFDIDIDRRIYGRRNRDRRKAS